MCAVVSATVSSLKSAAKLRLLCVIAKFSVKYFGKNIQIHFIPIGIRPGRKKNQEIQINDNENQNEKPKR